LHKKDGDDAMAYDPNNIFARILRKELPCVKIFEDEYVLSFLDIMPQVEGHTLVIPKEAACDILDLSAASASRLIVATQHIARAIKSALTPPGIMVMQLNGAAAGQTVPHIHFHILPRHQGIDMKLHARQMVDPKVLEPVAARIRAAL
jgi:histidine triad (HIT) family protein